MIRVSVHLISAVDGRVQELARMDIINDESGGVVRRNYQGRSYVGRDTARLDKATVSKVGQVQNWESERFHVWNLVRAMLQAMGYNEGRAQHAQSELSKDNEIIAGDAFRNTVVSKASFHDGDAPLWRGWVIMDAFRAGIAWERQRNK